MQNPTLSWWAWIQTRPHQTLHYFNLSNVTYFNVKVIHNYSSYLDGAFTSRPDLCYIISKIKMTWILSNTKSSEVGEALPNPDVGDADEADDEGQDVEPHL